MELSVIGLGKLGAPLAAVLASKGHQVVGVDVSHVAVERLNAGKAPVEETGLQDLIDECGGRLRATLSVEEAVLSSSVTFIIVPTPSGPDGTFVLDYLMPAVEAVGTALKVKPDRHTVVITSTVMPGSTDGPIRHALEEASGLVVGRDVGLCYSPEFIALGSVIHDMLHPDLILVGESDTEAGDTLEEVARGLAEGEPPVMRMALVNAELAKIAVNTFVTTKISFANMLGEICEGLVGADVHVVTAAAGLDSRIGRRYLQGATAYGGPCFPRDTVAFSALARRVGTSADIAEATAAINDRQVGRLVKRAADAAPRGGRVAVLGLSYKPGTHVVEESAGVAAALGLAERGLSVRVFDPLAMPAARAVARFRARAAWNAWWSIRIWKNCGGKPCLPSCTCGFDMSGKGRMGTSTR